MAKSGPTSAKRPGSPRRGEKSAEWAQKRAHTIALRCPSLAVDQLRARWKILYQTEEAPRFSRDLLMRAVAYRMQERVLGGLKPATRRLFERVSQDARARRRNESCMLWYDSNASEDISELAHRGNSSRVDVGGRMAVRVTLDETDRVARPQYAHSRQAHTITLRCPHDCG
jgi:hypothetical protein